MNKAKYTHLIYLAVTIILPCLLICILYGQWFPYFLNGKHFLVFYLMYMLTGYGVLISSLVKGQDRAERRKLAKALLWLTLIIAIPRGIQGVYHHKPIGFLVMLSFIHIAILIGLLWRKGLKKNTYNQN